MNPLYQTWYFMCSLYVLIRDMKNKKPFVLGNLLRSLWRGWELPQVRELLEDLSC
jgi:hypothetical protein